LHPSITQATHGWLSRFIGVYGLLVSTTEGVPIIREVIDEEFMKQFNIGDGQLRFANIFSIVSDQVKKLRLGDVTSCVLFFNNLIIIHANLHPLVFSFIASSDANVGLILELLPSMSETFGPIRAALERLENEQSA